MIDKREAKEFIESSKGLPLLDVRSPAEYEQGHIPGALNLPLFSNEERGEVGTLYKKKGKESALIRGLEIVGPKMATFVKSALSLKSREILLYCWRGGMRSGSMAWLLKQADLKPTLLIGGYKGYRSYIREELSLPYRLILVGGYTGSGKTELLHLMESKGYQVVDLEGIAHHKGSAFGALGEESQPTNEMFENNLYQRLSLLNRERAIWLEDESHNIGKNHIPQPFWEQMRSAPLILLESPYQERVERLVKDYGEFPREELANSIKRIEKRLGYDRCKEAMEAALSGEMTRAAQLCLHYYDRAYGEQLQNRFCERFKALPRVDFTSPLKSDFLKRVNEIERKIIENSL